MSHTDKDFFQLSISISKALNPMETPLKLKHARSAIIYTHRTKETKTFWALVTKQPLMESRFTAWKFCHLVHKVLREGHSSALKHSQTHKKLVYEMGKLWGHLQDGVGICIQAYTRLLVTKLEFHAKNPYFPGSLALDFKDVERMAGDDINFYFQLGVEIFDYLDDIIALQAKVFTSINTYRMSSMTPQGQCRLAPLIPLIQDSNPLYDMSVRLMFKLHANLPNDVLAGHRDRFRTVFNQLNSFYGAVRPLQYFADLIQVPHLPTSAPNFSSSVDFGSYVPPVVVVPPEPEPIMENLVDVNTEQMQSNWEETQESQTQEMERLLHEREDFIRELQLEVERLRTCLNSMSANQKDEVKSLQEQIQKLNSHLNATHEELVNMRTTKADLELQLQSAPILREKAVAEEERANSTEEKFNKLKNMYSQIRDEHINLIRQNAEATKQLNVLKVQNTGLIEEKQKMVLQLEDLSEKQSKFEETQSKVTDLELQGNHLNSKYTNLVDEHNQLQQEFVTLQHSNSAQISELKTKIAELQSEIAEKSAEVSSLKEINKSLLSKTEDYCQRKEQLELSLVETNQKVSDVQKTSSDLQSICDSLTAEIQTLTALNEELKKSNEMLEQEKARLNTEYEAKIHDLQTEISDTNVKSSEEIKAKESQFTMEMDVKQAEIVSLQSKALVQEKEINDTTEELIKVRTEKQVLEQNVEDLTQMKSELDNEYKRALEQISLLEESLNKTQADGKNAVRTLLGACIKSAEKLAIRGNTEKEFSNVSGTSAYYMMVAEEMKNTLNELRTVYGNYVADNSMVEGLSKQVVLTGHLLSILQIQGMSICNTSADIEAGEKIAEEIKNIDKDINSMFEALKELSAPEVVLPRVVALEEKLERITSMIHDLSKKPDDSSQLGDLVETELATMDEAIEEAASKIVELLSNSRAIDSGIKLEVNERILDACTSLMMCIRILVQKAKVLQAEIVSVGKGTASAKEFYKRNNQWSEGLISAAKSVGTGANLLVEAANKAVSGEAKHHLDIIVAAQEIAACTAQLVVASRVKAPRDSKNLAELGTASRNVSQATGAVVATAKDCSQHLEDLNDLDLSKLTVHQAKTLEMEIQVKVLELEQALQSERLKLAAFRRKNYRNECD